MTTNPLPPTGPPPPPPPGAPVPPPKKSINPLVVGVAACGGLFLVFVILVAVIAAASPKKNEPEASTCYSGSSICNGDPTTSSGPSTTAGPTTTAAPRTTAAPPHVPTPEDFSLEIIELSRSCFGSAGCNVTFKIAPTYSGPPTNASKSYRVVYEVRGGDDVKSENFTVHGTEASVKSESFISTPQNPTLTAVVVRVLPD